ncbi:MAG: T9SS type A sorting domain-containing protein [Candidatus Marinimicrobia bacterium]|nr:T9SS type A sorting domain-containing protein [Candidatus Neomarinimicrobiota bacterium]
MKQVKQRKSSQMFIGVFFSLIMMFSPLFAGIPGYYFQQLLFNFGGEDSILVNSVDIADNDVGNQAGPYGMIVDPEGKMWMGFYSGFSNEVAGSPGNLIKLTGIRCFMPDRTEASFSPIELLEFPDGSKDTLYVGNPFNGYCRGISKDDDGNILYTAGPTLYKIDYHDGSAIAKWDPSMAAKPLRTHVSAVQDCSYIYFAPYPQYEQLHVLDLDLNFISAGISLTPTLENAIQVRTLENGTTQLFSATHSNGQGIFVYESTDPSSVPFTLVDTIGNYTEETDTNIITYIAWATSLDWVNKVEGILLFGNHNRAMTTVNAGKAPASSHAARWVAIDVDTDEILYMFGAPWYDVISGDAYAKEVLFSVPENYLGNQVMGMKPSGASINNIDGNIEFILSDIGLNCVQSASFSTAVSKDIFIPYNLTLEQNYPNPFNPMTSIQFDLEQGENVILDLYDLSGKRVLEVFSGNLDAGTHNMILDASDLASGTYIYTLHTRVMSVSRKMTLLK